MKNIPAKKSIWRTSDGQEFSVENVIAIEKGMWVYYQKIKTGQTYQCLLESFLLRFTPSQSKI
jgi:hypothetical protein